MKVIRFPELKSRVGYSRMHIFRLEKAGKFPRPVPLGEKSVGWLESEIQNWIAERVAEREVA